MGNNLFGADIAGTLARELGPSLLVGTLKKITTGARPSNPTDTVPKTEPPYNFRGFPETMDNLKPETMLQDAVGVVYILGDTLPSGIVPEAGDKVSLAGVTDARIVKVTSDPDAAGYLCQHA